MTRLDCDQVVSKLDELVDGTLDEVAAGAARSHLETCPGCRTELESIERLVSDAQELPRSTEPNRDLWPEIANRIEDRRVVRGPFDRTRVSQPRRVWMAAAAAAVLIVSVTIAYMAGLQRAQTQNAAQPRVDSPYMMAAYGGLAEDLEQARDQLRSSLDQRRDELSPETWSVVMENLVVIDDAIERIEVALVENPNDGRLNRQLTVAYRRQIDLLQRATRLPTEVQNQEI